MAAADGQREGHVAHRAEPTAIKTREPPSAGSTRKERTTRRPMRRPCGPSSRRYGAPERVLGSKKSPCRRSATRTVLIRMRGTSVTPQTGPPSPESGAPAPGLRMRRPQRPVRGSDVAGVVEAVGQRVTDLRAATKCSGPPEPRRRLRGGGAGGQLVRKPARLTFTDAAASVMMGSPPCRHADACSSVDRQPGENIWRARVAVRRYTGSQRSHAWRRYRTRRNTNDDPATTDGLAPRAGRPVVASVGYHATWWCPTGQR